MVSGVKAVLYTVDGSVHLYPISSMFLLCACLFVCVRQTLVRDMTVARMKGKYAATGEHPEYLVSTVPFS